MKAEKTLAQQQKEIINELVMLLSQDDPSLYYVDSDFIARLVYDYIHKENRLNAHKKDKVKELSVDDIRIKLSYK